MSARRPPHAPPRTLAVCGPALAVVLAAAAALGTGPAFAQGRPAGEPDRNLRLPPILAPDRDGPGTRPVLRGGRGVAGDGASPLGALFRAAEEAQERRGFSAPDMTVPQEQRRRLRLPDFNAPLPRPASVVEAAPHATAEERPYVSNLLRIPRSEAREEFARPRGLPPAIQPPPSPPLAAPPAASAAQPTAEPARPPGPPSVTLSFSDRSAAVGDREKALLAELAAMAAGDPGTVVRLQAEPAGISASGAEAEIARRLVRARIIAIQRELAARRVGSERIATDIPSESAGSLVTVSLVRPR